MKSDPPRSFRESPAFDHPHNTQLEHAHYFEKALPYPVLGAAFPDRVEDFVEALNASRLRGRHERCPVPLLLRGQLLEHLRGRNHQHHTYICIGIVYMYIRIGIVCIVVTYMSHKAVNTNRLTTFRGASSVKIKIKIKIKIKT